MNFYIFLGTLKIIWGWREKENVCIGETAHSSQTVSFEWFLYDSRGKAS